MNENTTAYATISGGQLTWTGTAGPDFATQEEALSNLTVRAVETRAGWIGQVVVGNEIVWESKPTALTGGELHRRSRNEALEVAKSRVHSKLAALFGAL